MSRYGILAARLGRELSNLEKTVLRATQQADKARRTGDDDYCHAVGLSLQNFYMGSERLFELIAQEIDGSVPSGSSSHRLLLDQMALGIPQVRPPVVEESTRLKLDEYRKFRHFVVHNYGFELQGRRVLELADELPECFGELRQQMQAFTEFLVALEQELSWELKSPQGLSSDPF